MSAVTIFPNVSGTTLQRHDWTTDELVEHLRNAGPYLEKNKCPLVKLATFGEIRSEHASLRHDANVIEVHGIEGDYDGGEVSLSDAQVMLFENSVQAILYTSASHRREKPRWRVLCLLSRPIPARGAGAPRSTLKRRSRRHPRAGSVHALAVVLHGRGGGRTV